MLPLIEEDVPEFLMQRDTVAYCSQLHVNKHSKSSLLLSRKLKFYEFRKKELWHHIDLRDTCLKQLASELLSYSGPISSFLIRDDVADISGDSTSYSMLHAVEDLPLSIGKYVWLNEHIYLLLRCWNTLLVLQRPKEQGSSFILIAQHENVQDYRLVKGPIEYQAYVELQFTNGKRLRTNFQTAGTPDASTAATPTCSSSTASGFKRLLQRVHCARAELLVQRAQTQQDFVRARELQTFGVPGQRSPLLEEKQLLRRCGDVWTRICGDCLVLGTMLINASGINRCSTLHALRPLLCLPNGCGLNFTHRLYELPLQSDGQPPEDYDELAQFWACHEQHSQGLSWRPANVVQQLPPERSAVLLLCLQLEDLLMLEQIQLLATYELHGECVQQLQLQLASINVASLLQQQELHVANFSAKTLHQDFLAVIMSHTAHGALRLQFQSVEQLAQFEQLLIEKLGFVATTVPDADPQMKQSKRPINHGVALLDDDDISTPQDFAFGGNSDRSSSNDCETAAMQHRIFYNRTSELLLLRNDPGQHWHMFARSETRLCLLLRRLLQDLLKLHCNLSLLEMELENECSRPANAALLLESALRDELQAKAELYQQPETPLTASRMKIIHQLEMSTDLLLTVIKSQSQTESTS